MTTTLEKINISTLDREFILELMNRFSIDEDEIIKRAREYISDIYELDTNMIINCLIEIINDILLDKLREYLSPDLVDKLSDDLREGIHCNALASHNYANNTFEKYEDKIINELNNTYDDKAHIYIEKTEKQFEQYHF